MTITTVCAVCGWRGGAHDDDCTRRSTTPPGSRWGVRREPARGVTPADRAQTVAEQDRLLAQLRAMGRCA